MWVTFNLTYIDTWYHRYIYFGTQLRWCHHAQSVSQSRQEIEEDKKKAEQEGIAVTTPRKPRPHEPETDRRKAEKENFTVTVDLSKPMGVRHDVDPKPF